MIEAKSLTGFEMQDGVMYVSPLGAAFNKEIFDRRMQVAGDVWKRIERAIREAINCIWEIVKKAIDRLGGVRGIKRITKNLNMQITNKSRKGWHVPMNMNMPSQVIDRKPHMPNIRSNI